MTALVGIDPGPKTSGFVVWSLARRRVVESCSHLANSEVRYVLREFEPGTVRVAVEVPKTIYLRLRRGQPVTLGKEIIPTILETGKILEAARAHSVTEIAPDRARKAVCGTSRSKDPDVKRWLIRYLGRPGTKTRPGPTYGVYDHAWRALAVIFAANPKEMIEPNLLAPMRPPIMDEEDVAEAAVREARR